MKTLHRSLHPAAWSFTTILSAAMLGVTWTSILFLVFNRSRYQNHYTVLILGAIAIIIPLLLSQWLVRPVRLLAKAVKAVERGNFAPPALSEVSQAQNDIGYLARVFAKMTARVKADQEQHMSQQITDVLLRELNSSDIDWLGTTGHYQEIEAGTVLTHSGQLIDTFHLVLDGSLTVTSQFTGNHLDRIHAHDDCISEWEIARLGSGEVVGEDLLTGTRTTATMTIKAIETSLVLSICQDQLVAQLKQDAGFAARFYRAIAVILSNRLQTLMSHMGCNSLTQDQPLRDVLSMLGALNDSDIDWLVAIGQRQRVPANSVLIQQGRPIEALYILLDGILSVSTFDQVFNPFVRAFSVLDANTASSQEITRLSKGEMVGETLFLNAHLPPATVTALQDSLVLAIPRSQLLIKLEQDVGFASRFYRMLANLLSSRLQELLDRLGYGQPMDDRVTSLNGAIQADDELNFNVLDQMAIAGTRFDWMLRRLGGTEVA